MRAARKRRLAAAGLLALSMFSCSYGDREDKEEDDKNQRGGPNAAAGMVGTIDVVRHLIRAHPDLDFGLLLGADTYRDLTSGRWKESDALVKLVRVVPVRRKGVDSEIAGPEFEEVSSTAKRPIPPALTAAVALRR